LFDSKTVVKKSILFESVIDQINPWSAEDPYLYNLQINLFNSQKEVIEVSLTGGFKRVEIIDGNLLVNGKAIMFRGVNRHEWDPVRGRSITEEIMVKDIQLMKENNITPFVHLIILTRNAGMSYAMNMVSMSSMRLI
jgi:beta-galactosidase/beta-glucuronidase